jgi:hypothetical protein
VSRWLLVGSALAGMLAAGTSAARTQQRWTVQPEGRVDLLAGRREAVQGGFAVAVATSRSVRVGIAAGVGSALKANGDRASGRADLFARLVIDPYFEKHWAPYAVGALSARFDGGSRWRGAMVALAGIEGPRLRGVVPFAEAGYGGGVRVGLGFRRAFARRR